MSSPSTSGGSQQQPPGGYLKREDLLGKSVVSKKAEIIGTVKDIAVSMDGKIAIQVERKPSATGGSNEDIFVGADEIQAVGDVILLKDPNSQSAPRPMPPSRPTVESAAGMTSSTISSSGTSTTVGTPANNSGVSPPPYPGSPPASTQQQQKICPKCGYSNSANSRFCIKCGTKLS